MLLGSASINLLKFTDYFGPFPVDIASSLFSSFRRHVVYHGFSLAIKWDQDQARELVSPYNEYPAFPIRL